MTSRQVRERPSLDPHTEEPDDVVVICNGRSISGWKSVEITRRLDAASGSFSLEIQHVEPWPIRAGDEVRILVGGTTVVTGYVDTIDAAIDANTTSLTVSGRDRTEDLVDCAAPESPAELRGVNLEELAQHLCAPLSIDVITRLPEDLPFDVFRVNRGETGWSALERACRKRGVLAFPDERGFLVLAHPATSRSDRDLGDGDYLAANLRWQQAERFRVYVVTGQRPGSDDSWGAAVSEIRGEASDLSVDRPRRLVRAAEGPVNQAQAEQYAQWMATFRAARAAQVSLQLQGWRQSPRGELWKVNQLVAVAIKRWRLEGELLLINAVKFSYPPRTTTLELVRRDAYAVEPQIDNERDPLRAWGDDSRAPEDEE